LIPAEENLLLSLIHKDFLGAIHSSWDQIAAYINLVMPRDADNACYRMYNPDNVCSHYHTALKLGIQEVILPPIKDSVGEMAHPYVDFQGTQPPRQLSESKDLVLFPRAFDCRLETEEELLPNKR
jgi:hypothetical protein